MIVDPNRTRGKYIDSGLVELMLRPRAASFRHIIQDGFVPQLWRSFMSSLDGQSAWKELWNRLDDSSRAQYFRANIYLPNSALAIDDVNRIDELRVCAHSQSQNDGFGQTTAFALLISGFFFELTSAPLYENGKVCCKGSIRCRLQGQLIVQALNRVHPSELIFMTDHEIVGYYKGDEDLCHMCRRYGKNVEFVVHHLDESVSIFLQSVIEGRRQISGFPRTMRWFQDQQGLNVPFGKPFPDPPRVCEGCYSPGQIGTVFYINVKGANIAHKIFQLGSDLADRDSSHQ